MLVAGVLVALVAAPAVAQSATQQPVLDGIAAQYRDASRLWRPRLLPIAQQLFLVLAGNGFAAAGERAIGSSVTVSPSGIIDIGRQTALTVLNTLDLGVMLKNPAMAVFAALAALIIALAYVVIADRKS